jgi:hypothetical protein
MHHHSLRLPNIRIPAAFEVFTTVPITSSTVQFNDIHPAVDADPGNAFSRVSPLFCVPYHRKSRKILHSTQAGYGSSYGPGRSLFVGR